VLDTDAQFGQATGNMFFACAQGFASWLAHR
jgi:hypothetical protein